MRLCVRRDEVPLVVFRGAWLVIDRFPASPCPV